MRLGTCQDSALDLKQVRTETFKLSTFRERPSHAITQSGNRTKRQQLHVSLAPRFQTLLLQLGEVALVRITGVLENGSASLHMQCRKPHHRRLPRGHIVVDDSFISFAQQFEFRQTDPLACLILVYDHPTLWKHTRSLLAQLRADCFVLPSTAAALPRDNATAYQARSSRKKVLRFGWRNSCAAVCYAVRLLRMPLGEPELRSPYAYVWQIESDARIEQKRGRSQQMESIKRALKGMFKRGKKGKEEEEKPAAAKLQKPMTATSTQRQPPSAPPKDTERASPTSPNATKRLPPTHPLTTGQHEKPDEAVPQNHTAQPGPARDPHVAHGPKGAGKAKEQEQFAPQVSPAALSHDDGAARSDAVSAIEDETPPAPPPKTGGAADAIHAAPPEAAVAAPAGKISLA